MDRPRPDLCVDLCVPNLPECSLDMWSDHSHDETLNVAGIPTDIPVMSDRLFVVASLVANVPTASPTTSDRMSGAVQCVANAPIVFPTTSDKLSDANLYAEDPPTVSSTTCGTTSAPCGPGGHVDEMTHPYCLPDWCVSQTGERPMSEGSNAESIGGSRAYENDSLHANDGDDKLRVVPGGTPVLPTTVPLKCPTGLGESGYDNGSGMGRASDESSGEVRMAPGEHPRFLTEACVTPLANHSVAVSAFGEPERPRSIESMTFTEQLILKNR